MRLGANQYAGKIYSQIPAGHSVDATGFLINDATGAVVGTPVKNADGSIARWLDADGNPIAGAGFGGYDPNAPPPGYDPICWRGTNWDYQRGLTCRLQPDGSTTLENKPIGAWLPWTQDLGATAPPADSAAAYLIATGQILPHPGPLTLAQAQALLASVGPRADDMTADEFLAEVDRIRRTVDVQYVASDAAKELQQVLADIQALSEARDALAEQIQAGGSGNPFVWTHAFLGTAADLTRLNDMQKQLDALHARARVLQGLPATTAQITTPTPVDYVPPPPVDFGPVSTTPILGPGETLGPTGEVVSPGDYVAEPPEGYPPHELPPGIWEPVPTDEDGVPLGPPTMGPQGGGPAPTTLIPEEPGPLPPSAPGASKLLYAGAIALGLLALLGGRKRS